MENLKINNVARKILLDYMDGGFKIDSFEYSEVSNQDIIYLVKTVNKKKNVLKIIKDYTINQIRIYKNGKFNNVIKL